VYSPISQGTMQLIPCMSRDDNREPPSLRTCSEAGSGRESTVSPGVQARRIFKPDMKRLINLMTTDCRRCASTELDQFKSQWSRWGGARLELEIHLLENFRRSFACHFTGGWLFVSAGARHCQAAWKFCNSTSPPMAFAGHWTRNNRKTSC
jgi:hypothetical protein